MVSVVLVFLMVKVAGPHEVVCDCVPALYVVLFGTAVDDCVTCSTVGGEVNQLHELSPASTTIAMAVPDSIRFMFLLLKIQLMSTNHSTMARIVHGQ